MLQPLDPNDVQNLPRRQGRPRKRPRSPGTEPPPERQTRPRGRPRLTEEERVARRRQTFADVNTTRRRQAREEEVRREHELEHELEEQRQQEELEIRQQEQREQEQRRQQEELRQNLFPSDDEDDFNDSEHDEAFGHLARGLKSRFFPGLSNYILF